MKLKTSKSEAKKEISNLFSEIESKTPKEIKNIKRLAMSYNVALGEKKKTFCKKCFSFYKNPQIKIKNKLKVVTCKNCGYVSRWRIK